MGKMTVISVVGGSADLEDIQDKDWVEVEPNVVRIGQHPDRIYRVAANNPFRVTAAGMFFHNYGAL